MIATLRLRVFRSTAAAVLAIAVLGSCGGGGAPPAPAAVAPTITAQPSAVAVSDGASAAFSVTATGDAPLAYQWRRDGVDLVNGPGVTGATGSALTLSAAYVFNGGQISVRVSNAAGAVVSQNALLTVTPVAPSITAQPANASVTAGAPAMFSVTTSGGTVPLSYQWRRNGTVITGATLASYTIGATVLGDNGATFRVDVINPAGTLASASATLTVTAVGRSWGTAVRINTGDAFSDPGFAQVGIDAAGNAISVWQEETPGAVRNAVWASRYAAGGAWSLAATIDNLTGDAVRPALAVTPSGVAVAAFPQSRANVLDLVTNRFSGAWGMPETIESVDITNADNPQVGLAPDGVATVAFAQSDGTLPRVHANRSNAAGTWVGAQTIDSAGPTSEPQVAVAANGHTLATWIQNTGPFTRALWASRNLGSGWSAPAPVAPDNRPTLSPVRVAADASGNVIAVWSQEQASGRYAVRSARMSAATGTWTTPVTLNAVPTRDAYSPQIGSDGNGNAVVVWHEPNVGVFSNRFDAATATWAGAVAAQPSGAPAGALPSLAVNGAGNAIAVWLQVSPTNGTQYEVWGAHYNASGAAWAAPLKLMTDPAAYALLGGDQQPTVALNANGEAVVVWYQRTDSPVTVGLWARVYR